MNTVHDNLITIKNKINKIALDCGRDPKSIELIAVSKTKPVELISQAINAGQLSFGENYVQEGIEKIAHFKQCMPDIPIVWQVNISNEQTKSGVAIDEVADLIKQIITLPNLRLRGLMAIPEIENDFAKQFAVFKQMNQLLESLKTDYPFLDTLSMGMSGDMQAAIEAGSTMVRIGSAIFGARQYV